MTPLAINHHRPIINQNHWECLRHNRFGTNRDGCKDCREEPLPFLLVRVKEGKA